MRLWPRKYKLEVGHEVFLGWYYHVWRRFGGIASSKYGFENVTEATEAGIEVIEEIRANDKLKRRHGV